MIEDEIEEKYSYPNVIVKNVKFIQRGQWDHCSMKGIEHEFRPMFWLEYTENKVAVGICMHCAEIEGGFAYYD